MFKEFGWRKLAVVAVLIFLVFIFQPQLIKDFLKPIAIIWICVQGGLDLVKAIGKIILAIINAKKKPSIP